MKSQEPDFRHIRTIDGKQDAAFEEFCCQIARRHKNVPRGSSFFRYRGTGGDGGVECVWRLINGEEWGWQAKFFFSLSKAQLDKSVKTALSIHPKLTRYHICVPFDLTGPTGRANKKNQKKKSEYEKYEGWVVEWKSLAKAQGRDVDFFLYDRSRLLDELIGFDENFGRQRFWFNVEQFGDEWFKKQLADAIKAAEPRYTPQLTVAVPIYAAFEALGRTAKWEKTVRALAREIDSVSERWTDCLTRPDLKDTTTDFPVGAKECADLLMRDLIGIKEGIEAISSDERTGNVPVVDSTSIRQALERASNCLSILEEDLESKHGSGVTDSVGFRQFMAEYDVSFPARHVDAARGLIATLQKLLEWTRDPLSRLPQSRAMLLLGPTGIGKTHSICDIAVDRDSRGLRSIVLLGEHFTLGEPWQQIIQILGLSPSMSREELLAAMDAAGEATEYPCIIFIDALNDTRPRDFWHNQLARLIEQVSRFPFLRLCVSCRSTYYEEVIASNVQIPEVDHGGFEGVEFDAAFEYFRFYGLEAPSMPLMQPEFSNPLFLRLVCETLRDSNTKGLPEGMLGISTLIDRFITSKNAKIAKVVDCHPKERLVHRALNRLVSEMSSSRTDSLSWQEAKNLVDSIWPSQQRSTSLFDHMIREGLIREEAPDMIKVSFDRLADHLLVGKYLESIPQDDIKSAFEQTGRLYFTIADAKSVRQNGGLLEALAVQVPEKYGLELTEVVEAAALDDARITLYVLDSLTWRSASSITRATHQLVRKALGRHETFEAAMEALLAIGTRTENPLNALWFHRLHASIAMAERDAALCPFLHGSFGQRKGLDKLIRWALQADLVTLSDEVAGLWATKLIWFCAAADRRVRDYATRAIVRVMEDHAGQWPILLERFSHVDDEYVVERCLAGAYAALLRKGLDNEIGNVAAGVYTNFFESDNLPQNAMVRDYARLIMELADVRNVLPGDLKLEQVRPPYKSEWPLEWPDKSFEIRYATSDDDFPKLFRSCMEDDFAIYTVPSALHGYPREEIKRSNIWIFKQVLDMGYSPDRLGPFDNYMLSHYGGGRGKETWAERIGKKYQWIALYRLIARVADNVTKERSMWDDEPLKIPGLHALGERNLDPTVLRHREGHEVASKWRIPVRYDFQRTEHLSDEAWLDTFDFPDSADALQIREPGEVSRTWLLLSGNLTWRSKLGEPEPEYPYRSVSMVLRSYLVRNADRRKCWSWLKRQNYRDVRMPEGYQMHGGFLGEYPWGLPFARYFEELDDEDEREAGIPCKLMPTSHFLNIHFAFDAYQPNAINALVPAKEFFDYKQMRWDTRSMYLGSSGASRFVTLPLTEDGPILLLAERQFLKEFLTKRGLSLFWALRTEKHYFDSLFGSHKLGYTEYTRAHVLTDREITNSEPLIERLRPADRSPENCV